MGELAKLWEAGKDERIGPLRRARKVAAVTVPHIAPPSGYKKGDDLPDPWQSLGARGVNSLSGKLSLALFPPQASFFIYEPDPDTLEELRAANAGKSETEVLELARQQLQEREKTILSHLAATAWRPTAYEIMRHGIVTGSPVVRLFRDLSPARMYSLDECVIRRNARGELRRLIVHEAIEADFLTEEMLASLPENERKEGNPQLSIWTCVKWTRDGWVEWSEIGKESSEVLGSRMEHESEDDVLWLAPRMVAKAGVDYAPSLGEELLGDLRFVEGLSQAIAEASVAAARLLWGVDPGSGFTAERLSRARNGAYLMGNREGVGAITTDKQADMSIAQSARGEARRDLELAFMLQTAIQRSGERVTAEEIRRMSQELDDGLGGVLSVLSDELQRPLVRKIHRLLVKNGTLEDAGIGDLRIVTGLEAVGRGQEYGRWEALIDSLQRALGPDAVAQSLSPSGLALKLGNLLGLDTQGVILSEQEAAAQAQQAQIQEATQAAIPGGMNILRDAAAAQTQ